MRAFRLTIQPLLKTGGLGGYSSSTPSASRGHLFAHPAAASFAEGMGGMRHCASSSSSTSTMWNSGWVATKAQQSSAETFPVLQVNEPLPPSQQRYRVEVAPARGRAACRVCCQPFPAGSLRVAMFTPSLSGDFELPRYCHSHCLDTTYRHTYPGANILSDVSKFLGISQLEDPALLAEAVTLILGPRGWKSFSAANSSLLRQLRDQQVALNRVQQLLGSVSPASLVGMLKKGYGVGADVYDAKLQGRAVPKKNIVSALADGIVFGKTPTCPICEKGMVLFNESAGVYRCTGSIDKYTQCTEPMATTVKRTLWPSFGSDAPGLSEGEVKEVNDIIKAKFPSGRIELKLPVPDPKFLQAKNNGSATNESTVVKVFSATSVDPVFRHHVLLCHNTKSPEVKLWLIHGGTISTKLPPGCDTPRVLLRATKDFKGSLQPFTGAGSAAQLGEISIPVVTLDTLKHVVAVGSFVATPELVRLYSSGGPVLDAKRIEEAKERREQRIEGDADSSSSKTKVVRVRGDGIPVDTDVPDADNYDVHDIFSATLSKTDLATGKNSFYIMQVLKHSATSTFHLWRRWGRTGDPLKSGDTFADLGSNSSKAIKQFEKLFQDKTGNDWNIIRLNYSKFEKKPRLFSLVQMVDLSKKNTTNRPAVGPSSDESELETFDKKTDALLNRMFDTDSLTQTLKQFDINIDKMPLGNLSESMIAEGRAILSEAQAVVKQMRRKEDGEGKQGLGAMDKNKKKNHKKATTTTPPKKATKKQSIVDAKAAAHLRAISSRFYTTIPQYLKHTTTTTPTTTTATTGEGIWDTNDKVGDAGQGEYVLNTLEKIIAKSNLLDDLDDIAATVKILELSSGMTGDCKKQQNYKSLNTTMSTVDPAGATYQMVEDYFKTSQNRSLHRGYNLKHVWEISRREEEKRFVPWEKDSNRKLLWHGSGFTNWVRILSQGLKIAPPEAPVSGYMFGKGIYFADTMSKSAGYCRLDRGTTGLMALAEVALGNTFNVVSSDSSLDLNAITQHKKQSTFAAGQTAPSGKGLTLPSGCVVPNGPLLASSVYNSLYHNEFIVYDVAQVRLRYLLEVEPQ